MVLSVWYNIKMLQASVLQDSTAHSCGCSDLLRRAESQATDQLQWDERQDEANRISWSGIDEIIMLVLSRLGCTHSVTAE